MEAITPWHVELIRLLAGVRKNDTFTGEQVLELCNGVWNLAFNVHLAGLPTAISVDAMFDELVRYKLPNYVGLGPPLTWSSESSESIELDETDSTDSD